MSTDKLYFTLSTEVKVANPHSNVDYYYGPYHNEKYDDGTIKKTSVDIATESTQYIKAIGLTVLCENEDGTFTEYWYKDIEKTLTLVQKQSESDFSWEELYT